MGIIPRVLYRRGIIPRVLYRPEKRVLHPGVYYPSDFGVYYPLFFSSADRHTTRLREVTGTVAVVDNDVTL